MEAAFLLFNLAWWREIVIEQKHWQAGDMEANPVALEMTFNLTVAQGLHLISMDSKNACVPHALSLWWISPKKWDVWNQFYN